jgi:hypothetical protein
MFALPYTTEGRAVSQFFAVAQRVTQAVDICHNLFATIARKRVPVFWRTTTNLASELLVS